MVVEQRESTSSVGGGRQMPWSVIAARGTRIAAGGLLVSAGCAMAAGLMDRPSLWPVFGGGAATTVICVGSTLWALAGAGEDFRKLLRYGMAGNGLRIILLAATVVGLMILWKRGVVSFDPLWVVGTVLAVYIFCSILDVRLMKERLAAIPGVVPKAGGAGAPVTDVASMG